MKRMVLGSVAVVAASLMLGGCYVAPDYSYVRGPDGGGAYYGRRTTVYDGGYDAPYGYGYYGDPYGYRSGVMVGVGTTWYGGSGYRRHDWDGDRRWHDQDHRGHWDHDGDRPREAPYRAPPRDTGRQSPHRDDSRHRGEPWRKRDDDRR